MSQRRRFTFAALGVVVIASASVLFMSAAAGASTTASVPFGWDNGLHFPCAKTVSPNQPNFFQTSFPFCTGQKSWTIDVESEQAGQFGKSCPGPVNQSFPINKSGSPLALQTFARPQGNYTVELKTDLYNTTHPCGSGYYTFFSWMDHTSYGGGPLPTPDQLDLSFTYDYNDYTPNGAARFIAGFQGYWDGSGHMIEIDLSSTKWADMDPDPLVVLNAPAAHFLLLDGRALGINVTKGQTASMDIDWGAIIKMLVARKLIAAPAAGWSATSAATQAVYIGTEARNDTASRAVVTDLFFTDWQTAARVGS